MTSSGVVVVCICELLYPIAAVSEQSRAEKLLELAFAFFYQESRRRYLATCTEEWYVTSFWSLDLGRKLKSSSGPCTDDENTVRGQRCWLDFRTAVAVWSGDPGVGGRTREGIA
jgi:hypothetical protein